MENETSYVEDRKKQRDNRRKNNKPSKDDYEELAIDQQSHADKPKKKKGK